MQSCTLTTYNADDLNALTACDSVLIDWNGPKLTQNDALISRIQLHTPFSVTFTSNHELLVIGENCFAGAQIDSITIPKTVVAIGDYAFESAYIGQFLLDPDSNLAIIGCSAFQGVTWTAETMSFDFGTIISIGEYAFADNACQDVVSVLFSSHMQHINTSAFSSSQCINEISFPEDSELLIIDETAFQFTPITGLHCPPKLQTIGDTAFGYCTKLDTVHISASVDFIGERAFSGSGLRFVSFDGDSILTSTPAQGFVGLSECTFILPASILTLADLCFSNSEAIAIVTPRNCKIHTIGNMALSYITSLTMGPAGTPANTVVFPSSMRSFGPSAFNLAHHETIKHSIVFSSGMHSLTFEGGFGEHCQAIHTVRFECALDVVAVILDTSFQYSVIEFIQLPCNGLEALHDELVEFEYKLEEPFPEYEELCSSFTSLFSTQFHDDFVMCIVNDWIARLFIN